MVSTPGKDKAIDQSQPPKVTIVISTVLHRLEDVTSHHQSTHVCSAFDLEEKLRHAMHDTFIVTLTWMLTRF